MITLGINAAFHDCSAALVRDGEVVAAAEEERFSHVKHGKRPVPFAAWQLPFNAIDYCLAEAGITLAQVDHFAYSFNPRLFNRDAPAADLAEAVWSLGSAGGEALPDWVPLPLEPHRQPAEPGRSPWDPLFLSYMINAPRQLASGVPHHLQARFGDAGEELVRSRWHFVEHHLAHEASAFLAAPFEDCAVLSMDGRGERATTSCGVWRDGRYRRLRQVDMPHSLGLLYEDVTRYLGFLHSSDEYKVMALASFGEPAYADRFRAMVQVDRQGGYRVQRAELAALFGPPRQRGGPIEQIHRDVAASLQQVLEESVLQLAGWLHRSSNSANLSLAGGVALNCVLNARLRDEGPFRRVWAQPAAGDAGTALGAALWIDREQRPAAAAGRRWSMSHAYLGPAYGDEEIERFLRWSRLRYRRLDDVAADTARLLAQDKVIGWFQGRMEFGPRALGARSILASPISPDMQRRLNEIKDREDFRPVAPVVLEERAAEWFKRRASRGGGEPAAVRPETDEAIFPAPYMLFIFDVRPERATRIPAVRHVDGTARVQTVNRDQHPRYYELLRQFEQLTGVPVLVNTSFNTRGEPIVCTPRDAVESFWTSPLDALVIGSFLLEKPA